MASWVKCEFLYIVFMLYCGALCFLFYPVSGERFFCPQGRWAQRPAGRWLAHLQLIDSPQLKSWEELYFDAGLLVKAGNSLSAGHNASVFSRASSDSSLCETCKPELNLCYSFLLNYN